MIAYALSMSASARTTQRAVGAVYGLTLLGGLALWGLAAATLRTPWMASVKSAYGFIAPGDAAGLGAPLELVDRILYVHLVPAYLWVAATSLLFINATNRLKPILTHTCEKLCVGIFHPKPAAHSGSIGQKKGSLTLLQLLTHLPI